MAKIGEMQTAIQNKSLSPVGRLQSLLGRVDIKEKFENMLGKKAAGFMSSIMSLYNASPQLQNCEPMSIISAAAIAATLDLPINQNLGFAAIVPYGREAQFQMMTKGYVQLAMRTNQYKSINAAEVYEGEVIEWNRIKGTFQIDESKRKSDKIIGYVAHFELLSGFEKYLYMTVEQITAHGMKFSKSFNNPNGAWQKFKEGMYKKTPLKLLLSHYGVLSVETATMALGKALEFDQASVRDIQELKPEYIDSVDMNNDAIEPVADAVPEAPAAPATTPAPAPQVITPDSKGPDGELPLRRPK